MSGLAAVVAIFDATLGAAPAGRRMPFFLSRATIAFGRRPGVGLDMQVGGAQALATTLWVSVDAHHLGVGNR